MTFCSRSSRSCGGQPSPDSIGEKTRSLSPAAWASSSSGILRARASATAVSIAIAASAHAPGTYFFGTPPATSPAAYRPGSVVRRSASIQ